MTTPAPRSPAQKSPAAPIRVVVADDHPAVLSGLVALLGSAPDITVVAEATDGDAALAATRRHRPDVVLTDVRMPGATGIEITPRLRETGANVLVISGFDLDHYVLGALAAGADGYLVKIEEPQRILAAVRDVHRGDAVLSASATRAVVAALRRRGGADGAVPGAEARGVASGERGVGGRGVDGGGVDGREVDGRGADGRGADAAAPPAAVPVGPEPVFTGREEDVLALVAEGLTNQQIANRLFVEVTTVKSHLSHALVKLQLDSRVQAALWWRRHRG